MIHSGSLRDIRCLNGHILEKWWWRKLEKHVAKGWMDSSNVTTISLFPPWSSQKATAKPKNPITHTHTHKTKTTPLEWNKRWRNGRTTLAVGTEKREESCNFIKEVERCLNRWIADLHPHQKQVHDVYSNFIHNWKLGSNHNIFQ